MPFLVPVDRGAKLLVFLADFVAALRKAIDLGLLRGNHPIMQFGRCPSGFDERGISKLALHAIGLPQRGCFRRGTPRVRPCDRPTKRSYTYSMNGVEHVTEPHSLRPNTLRVRRHRQRRREGLRLLTVEIPEPVIEAAITRGLLKPEDCAQSSSVIRSAFAAQLSDTALNWLTNNAVITSEQRTDAVAILQRISDWLEGAPA